MNGSLNLHPKVAATGLAGAVALIIIWVLSLAHVTVPPEVAGALVVLLGFIGGWLAPVTKAEAQPATK